MLNSNLKSTLKKWKLNEFELEISPKTLKSLFLSRFFDRYLVKISLILNIFKSAFQTWIQHKIFKKMVYNAKFVKALFWPYSDFSEIKSSIRNHVDVFEFFYSKIFLSENAATPSVWLASVQYCSSLLYSRV